MPMIKPAAKALLFTLSCFALESAFISFPMAPGFWFYPASLLFWVVMNAAVAGAALLLARIAFAVSGRRPEPSYLLFALSGACFFAGGAIFLTKYVPGRIYSPGNLLAMAALASLTTLVVLVFYVRSKASASKLVASLAPYLPAAWALFGVRFLFPKLELLPWTVAVPAFLLFMTVCPVVLAVGLTQKRAAAGIGLTATAIVLAGAALFANEAFVRLAYQGSGRAGVNRPDIVLLIVDTARADALTLPGGGEAKREWSSFPRFYATSHWTVPTHGSLFTGMLPSQHGSDYLTGTEELISPLREEAATLASILAGEGYDTRAFLANTYLSRQFGLQKGFSDYRVFLAPSFSSLLMSVHEKLYPVIDKGRRLHRLLGIKVQEGTDGLVRAMMKALKEKKGRPKLLVANLMETHGMTTHPGEGGEGGERIQPTYGRDAAGIPQVDERLGRAIRAWYDAEAGMVNGALDEFVGELKKTERWDNCLFIITSDHGELLGEHGDYGHTNWLYEEIVRIPLFIKYPGGREGAEDGRYLSQVDLFAEILRVAGVPAPAGIQGRSFDEANHPIVMEGKAFPGLAGRWPERYLVDQTAIISRKKPGFKLILYSNGRKELFDLNRDPKEQAPLADEALAAELEGELREYYASLPKTKSSAKKVYYNSLGYIK